MQSVQSMQKHKRAPQNHGFTAQVRLPALHTLHTLPNSGGSTAGKAFLLCQQHFSHTPEQFQSNDANPVGKQA